MSSIPKREREMEAWRRLRRSLGEAGPHQRVKLKVDGKEASSEGEVVYIVEKF